MAQNNSQWRQKYYDSIEELESKDKEWQTLEDLFKQAISRLALAAEGINDDLDNVLEELRLAIRKSKESHIIHTILDKLSKEIIKLDTQNKSTVSGDAGFLLKLLTQMELSGTAEKKSRKLSKELKSKKSLPQEKLIESFKDVLSEVVLAAILDAEKNTGSQAGGFLKQLFSKTNSHQSNETTQTSDQSLTEHTVLLDDKTLLDESDGLRAFEQIPLNNTVAMIQNVLVSIIDSLDIQKEIVEVLKNKIFAPETNMEILGLLEDVNGVRHGVINVDIQNDVREGVSGHQDILIRLIESLPLENVVKDKAEKLKTEFANGVTTTQLPVALKSIAGLVSAMRNNVKQEQKEFELFLQKLEGRLKEVHEHLSIGLQEQQTSYQSGIELDNTVKQQVKNIGGSVCVDSNIDDMEKTVQDHIDIIVKYIDLNRLKENERISRIEEQNKQLLEKLTVLEHESSSLREKIVATKNKALVDPLTQIPNRLAYEQRIKQEFARWRRYKSTLLIMVWDIDYFKKVNDEYGHQAGDKVLKVVAKLLSNNIRETDFIGRFGGEEFVGLMPETTQEGGIKIAEKIRTSIDKLEFHYRGKPVKISISCGITMFMENDTAENAFARADKALYQAKDQGRNRCVVAKPPSLSG